MLAVREELQGVIQNNGFLMQHDTVCGFCKSDCFVWGREAGL